jgi:hypothetical protein
VFKDRSRILLPHHRGGQHRIFAARRTLTLPAYAKCKESLLELIHLPAVWENTFQFRRTITHLTITQLGYVTRLSNSSITFCSSVIRQPNVTHALPTGKSFSIGQGKGARFLRRLPRVDAAGNGGVGLSIELDVLEIFDVVLFVKQQMFFDGFATDYFVGVRLHKEFFK